MTNKTWIVIVTVGIVFLAFPLIPQLLERDSQPVSNDATPKTEVEPISTDAVPVSTPPPQPPPRQPSVMTRMQFDQIGAGMTYAQCVQFIGCEGERARTSGAAGDEEYTWQIVNSPYDATVTGEASLRFRNGVMYGKGFNSSQGRRVRSSGNMVSAALPAQRPAAPPYICRPVYNAIKNGSTYAECAQLLGMEGTYQGRRAMSGGTISPDGRPVAAIADVYVWHNPSIPATLTLSFRDGKLTAREVSGRNFASGGFGGRR